MRERADAERIRSFMRSAGAESASRRPIGSAASDEEGVLHACCVSGRARRRCRRRDAGELGHHQRLSGQRAASERRCDPRPLSSGGFGEVCSGTLVSPTIFLTASHCTAFLEADPRPEFVTFDETAVEDNPSGLIPATARTNPAYRGGYKDDVSVMVLSTPVTNITPARLPALGELDRIPFDQSTRLTVVGYGTSEKVIVKGEKGPQFAFTGDRGYGIGGFNALTKEALKMSQNASHGDSGACYGDSGGPNFLGACPERRRDRHRRHEHGRRALLLDERLLAHGHPVRTRVSLDLRALSGLGWSSRAGCSTRRLEDSPPPRRRVRHRRAGESGMKALRFAVLLAVAAVAIPGVAQAGEATPAQAEALERLQAVSSTPVSAEFEEGAPRFVSATVPVDGASATERALTYLDAYRDLYGLSSPREQLQVVREAGEGDEHDIFFGQSVRGVPVQDAQLAVHLRGDSVVATNGAYLPLPPAATKPVLSAEEATAVAQTAAGRSDDAVEPAELTYFNASLTMNEAERAAWDLDAATHLAWRVSLPTRESLVDARTGRELIGYDPVLHAATDLSIRTSPNGVHGAVLRVARRDRVVRRERRPARRHANPRHRREERVRLCERDLRLLPLQVRAALVRRQGWADRMTLDVNVSAFGGQRERRL